MSYPQPSSTDPVLAGQTFFRLKTQLVSQGDIYESEVSALGFALGPDSDLANVRLNYFDESAPGSVASAIISSDRALVGRFDARNDVVLPSGSRGRILISPADYYNPFYVPVFTSANSQTQFIAPVIDVIQYFVSPPSLTPQRSDRTVRLQYLRPTGINGASMVIFPAYGRRSGFFKVANRTDAGISPFVRGITYGLSGNNGGSVVGTTEETLYQPGLGIAPGGFGSFVFKSSVSGMFDSILIGMMPAGGTPYPGGTTPIVFTISDDVL